MKEKSIFAQRLLGLRRAQGLTQIELAQSVGISWAAIRNYENSLREPNAAFLVALEEYFGVSGSYLLGLKDDPALPVSPSASTPQAKKEPPRPYLSRRGWEDLKTAGMVVALLGLLAAIIVITTAILQPAHAEETALAPHITRAAVPEVEPAEPAPLLPDVPLEPELLETVAEACARYNVPLEIALGVMETESCYQPDAVNGPCTGLYQINTDYAAAYIDALGVTDIAEPAQNIECGVWYLGQLLQKHGNTDLALMHYNLGNVADELWAAGIRSTAYTDKVNAAAAQINISRNGQ